MKASKGNVGRSVDRPDPEIRFYLFHGPDEAQSRGLAARLLDALGAEKATVAAGAVKSDPALLADEAGAIGLFGGKRLIWIEPAGDDIAAGVEAMLGLKTVESPALAIAGPLRKSSSLLGLAEASPRALAYAAYVPEGADAERMVVDVGRRYGLKISPPVAARLAESCGNDQAVVAQELQKLALYVDASPEAPKELDDDAVDAVGADVADADTLHLADLALSGKLGDLSAELACLSRGADAIPVVRALQRRLLQLAPARTRIERGESLDAVMTSMGRSLFWKDKPVVAQMLSRWDSQSLATVASRAAELERSLIFSAAPEQETLGEELIAIARAAAARR